MSHWRCRKETPKLSMEQQLYSYKIIFLLNRVYLWIYIWGSMLIVGGYIIWFLSRVANWIELDCLDSVAFYASHYHLVGLLCCFLVFPHVTFLLQIPDGLPRVQ